MTAGELAFWCVLVVLLRNRAAMDFVGVISALAVLLLYFLIVAGAARFVAAILTCGLR